MAWARPRRRDVRLGASMPHCSRVSGRRIARTAALEDERAHRRPRQPRARRQFAPHQLDHAAVRRVVQRLGLVPAERPPELDRGRRQRRVIDAAARSDAPRQPQLGGQRPGVARGTPPPGAPTAAAPRRPRPRRRPRRRARATSRPAARARAARRGTPPRSSRKARAPRRALDGIPAAAGGLHGVAPRAQLGELAVLSLDGAKSACIRTYVQVRSSGGKISVTGCNLRCAPLTLSNNRRDPVGPSSLQPT